MEPGRAQDATFTALYHDRFYLGLVEHLAHRLDYLSLQEGRLQQTYEIFDLAGLSWSIVSMGAINFTKDVLQHTQSGVVAAPWQATTGSTGCI